MFPCVTSALPHRPLKACVCGSVFQIASKPGDASKAQLSVTDHGLDREKIDTIRLRLVVTDDKTGSGESTDQGRFGTGE